MPNFRFNKTLDIARNVRAFLNLEGGVTRGAVPDPGWREGEAGNGENGWRGTSTRAEGIEGRKRELSRKRQEFREIRDAERAAKDGPKGFEHKRRKKRVDQEIFRLEREIRAAEEGWADGPVTGALPDFLVIGVMKGGTTYLYHLLSQHPLVEPAASKEVHFFDTLADEEDTEWYRQNFPTPRWKDGGRTITGEATPYIHNPAAPEKVAQAVPEARLVALLRNPVDRAFSHYHQMVRRGGETRTFEEAVEAEVAKAHGDKGKKPKDARTAAGPNHRNSSYLSRGVYVDQLVRWSEFFDDEQMLVLRSEDFFKSPVGTLKTVLGFLDLPEWEPESPKSGSKRQSDRKKFKGNYQEEMAPATRRRLEEFFEPHNERLYDHLGRDFGW